MRRVVVVVGLTACQQSYYLQALEPEVEAAAPAVVGLQVGASFGRDAVVDGPGHGRAPDAPDPPEDTWTPPPTPVAGLYALSSELQWPESGAWDDVNRAFYVGSLSLGHVLEVSADGEERVMWAPDDGAAWQTWGVELDAARRQLLVCARREAGGVSWRTLILDVDRGRLVASVDMAGVAAGAQCRDYAVHGRTAWVTDRARGHVYALDLVEHTLSPWTTAPPLDAVLWGLDGIAVAPGGEVLLVANSRPASLLRIRLDDPDDVVEVGLSGLGFGLQAGHGLDALEVVDGALWIAAVNRLVKVVPEDDDWTIGVRTVFEAPIDGVSGLTVADGALYGVNGDPFAWTLGVGADLPFEIARIDEGALVPAP